MKLSIVIPARNEEANIEKMSSLLFRSFSKYIDELIIVNDCSTDDTKTILDRLSKKNKRILAVHRRTNPGVGNAIKAGYLRVPKTSDYILSLDCDFTKNISDIKKMIALVQKEPQIDLVLGARYIKGGKLVGYPLPKKIANRIFHFLAKVFLNFKFNDVTNNFKLMKREVLVKIQPKLKSRGFSINAETGLYPIIYGFKIRQSPVSWIGRSEDMGVSSFKVAKAGPGYIEVLKDVIAEKYFKDNKYSLQNEKTHFNDLVKKTGETNFANLHPIAKVRFEKKAKKIIRLIVPLKNPKILEIGCGTGLLSDYLLQIKPDLNIVGMDLSAEAIKIAKKIEKKYKNVKFISGNVMKTKFKDNQFDVVLGNSILHHLPFNKIMSEVVRILKPGGVIWFSEPNYLNPQIFLTKNIPFIKKMLQDSPTETAFTRWKIKKDLSKFGFKNIKVIPFDFFHPLIPNFLIKSLNKTLLSLEKIPLIKEMSGALEISAVKKAN